MKLLDQINIYIFMNPIQLEVNNYNNVPNLKIYRKESLVPRCTNKVGV